MKMKELMKANQLKNKRRMDANLSRPTFKEGDLVLVERPTHVRGASTKLSYTYIGPYRIVKKLSDISYVIANVRGRANNSVIHAWHLRAFVSRDGDVACDNVDPTYVPHEAVNDLPVVQEDPSVLHDDELPVEEIQFNDTDILLDSDDEPSPTFSPLSVATLSQHSHVDVHDAEP